MPHIECMLATQEVRRIMKMVFRDPLSSVTTYRRLHIQSIIKAILLSPDSELSPCVLTRLLVRSGHSVCYVKPGQVWVDLTRVNVNEVSDVRKLKGNTKI